MFTLVMLLLLMESECKIEKGLVPDCDGDLIAESRCPKDVCYVETGLLYWHREDGALMATVRWKDAEGRWWVKAKDARRDETGCLIVEEDSCFK